jgi:hypothetical protein
MDRMPFSEAFFAHENRWKVEAIYVFDHADALISYVQGIKVSEHPNIWLGFDFPISYNRIMMQTVKLFHWGFSATYEHQSKSGLNIGWNSFDINWIRLMLSRTLDELLTNGLNPHPTPRAFVASQPKGPSAPRQPTQLKILEANKPGAR